MNPNDEDAIKDLDITGARARWRLAIRITILVALILPWFFSPWRKLFFHAIKSNNVGLVRTMLSLGADANKAESSGKYDFYSDTPLVAAVRHPCSSPEVIRLLLEHQADPNKRAGRHGRCNPLKYIDPKCPNAVALAELLVAAGAKVKACGCTSALGDSYGSPLLAHLESVELAKYFLDQGADPNQVCDPKETAPIDTVSEEIKALYFEHGAKVVPGHYDGKTMLHRFAERGVGVDGQDTAYRLSSAELALTHGADVNAVDAKGFTPMDYANQQNDEAMVALLARYGGKAKKTDGFQDGAAAEEDQSEYSSFRTFAQNVHPAPGCSLKLVGENRSIMEEGENLSVIKGTVATARVRCPQSGYLHYGVLGMGPPVPKRINMPLQAGLTSVEVTFDQPWSNGVMHWYYTRGRVPNLLQAITRGEVREIAVRYVNVGSEQ